MTSRIKSVKVFKIDIPFRQTFKHNLYDRKTSDSLLLCLELDDGTIAWGESLPRDYVTQESSESVLDNMSIFNSLEGMELEGKLPSEQPQFDEFLSRFSKQPASRTLVELALLDAAARSINAPVRALFSESEIEQPELVYSAVIPSGSAEKTAKYALMAKQMQLSNIKLKATQNLDHDLECISIVKSMNPQASLRIDANNAWTKDTALNNCLSVHDAGIDSIEQPFSGQLKDWAQLKTSLPKSIKLIADEAIVSLDDAQDICDLDAADILNIKIGKVGGLEPALAIANICYANGKQVALGAHVGETSLMTNAGVTFASLLPNLVHLEGAYGEMLLEKDPFTPPTQFGLAGRLDARVLLKKPGWGVDYQKT